MNLLALQKSLVGANAILYQQIMSWAGKSYFGKEMLCGSSIHKDSYQARNKNELLRAL